MTDGTDAPSTPRRPSGQVAAIVVAAVALAVTGFIVATIALGSGSTIEVVIPDGTGAAVDAGDDVDVVPSLIEASVGDTITLVNQDSRPHVVGPWTVMPGTEYSFTFTEPGDFSGACSAHPDKAVRIVAT